MTDWSPRCILCAARDRQTRLDSGHCCPACASRIAADLSLVLSLAAQASTEPRQGTGGTRSVPASRPPLNVDGLDPELATVEQYPGQPHDQRPTVLAVLEGWERLCRSDLHMSPYGPASVARGGATLTGTVTFLQRAHGWATAEPTFPLEDYAAEVAACVRALRRYDVDAQASGFAVPCPTMHDDGGECGYRLRFGDGTDEVTCRRCRVTRDVRTLVAVGMSTAQHEMWVDPEVVTRRYGITASTMKRWARAGHVQRNHGRYLLSDLESIMAGDTPRAAPCG